MPQQDTELGVWLEELTWEQAGVCMAADPVLLIPVGAIAKEHGPHLPLNTDYLIARELARRTAQILPVLVAPVVCFGYYPAFRHYPGSQHLSAQTYMALMRELLEGFISQGVRKVVILNTGVSTEDPLRIVVRELYETSGVRVRIAPILQLGLAVSTLFSQRWGGHGDEHETSILLALRPESVQMPLAQCDYGNLVQIPSTILYEPSIFCNNPDSGPDYSATGVRGDPTLATPDKGEKALEAMTQDIVQGLSTIFPELKHKARWEKC